MENKASKFPEIFVARQPIFDINRHVYAYELLFRSGSNNFFQAPLLQPSENSASDPLVTAQDEATMQVIKNAFLIIGLERLTANKPAFINFTQNLLDLEFPRKLPKDFVVVEILETVNPSETTVEACRRLERAGYTLALDDFVLSGTHAPLMDFSRIVKVDFMQSDLPERAELARVLLPKNKILLGEKVETNADFEAAKNVGYSYFQGYFFCKPEIISEKELPGSKLHYLRILKEIQQPSINFQRLESTIREDITLTYKILKYVNSPFFGLRTTVNSIRHALTLLGEREIKNWVSLAIIAFLGADKPNELLRVALVRAKFCELLTDVYQMPDRKSEAFLLGMFSLIDTFIGRPLPEIIKDIPISDDVKQALLGQESKLRSLYQTMFFYERGDWDGLKTHLASNNLPESSIPKPYLEAVEWAQNVFTSK